MTKSQIKVGDQVIFDPLRNPLQVLAIHDEVAWCKVCEAAPGDENSPCLVTVSLKDLKKPSRFRIGDKVVCRGVSGYWTVTHKHVSRDGDTYFILEAPGSCMLKEEQHLGEIND